LSLPTTAPQNPPSEKYPAFEDEEGHIKIIKGKTLSKSNGWWSGVLLVDTYSKLQVKIYLWQERDDKNNPGQKIWKRKQSYTINPFNWPDMKKVIDELLEEKKTLKPTTTPFQKK